VIAANRVNRDAFCTCDIDLYIQYELDVDIEDAPDYQKFASRSMF